MKSQVVTLAWRYLPTIVASSLIMLDWALVLNNLGRRRYPLHWAAGATFMRELEDNKEKTLSKIEEEKKRKGKKGRRGN